jgi:hypothetical protein
VGRRWPFRLALAFFGLTTTTNEEIQQARVNLFSVLHQIIFHGKGGYDYDTVYNMPIWLRKFTYAEMKKFYDAEAEAAKSSSQKSNQSNLVNPDGTVNTPAFKAASQPYKKQSSYK